MLTFGIDYLNVQSNQSFQINGSKKYNNSLWGLTVQHKLHTHTHIMSFITYQKSSEIKVEESVEK